jgi:hypothetical protein
MLVRVGTAHFLDQFAEPQAEHSWLTLLNFYARYLPEGTVAWHEMKNQPPSSGANGGIQGPDRPASPRRAFSLKGPQFYHHAIAVMDWRLGALASRPLRLWPPGRSAGEYSANGGRSHFGSRHGGWEALGAARRAYKGDGRPMTSVSVPCPESLHLSRTCLSDLLVSVALV